ncbi:unnamed protein product [Penicillium camemberti]|uniref:Str. FM013 n=1 Tax=Penicillium camemberti (strain FM 013) TaxID=1429867 RepID=A0A0G4PJH4_PENC3|nr:unnamed protein product [Penicillium camemberti]
MTSLAQNLGSAKLILPASQDMDLMNLGSHVKPRDTAHAVRKSLSGTGDYMEHP